MLKNLNLTKKALLLGTALATGFASHAAFADPINATDSIGYFNVTVAGNGTNLIGATQISSSTGTGTTQSAGTGDMSGIGAGTAITSLTTLFPGGVNGGNGTPGSAYSFMITGAGVFTETANPVLQSSSTAPGGIGSETYYLLGTFVPSGTLTAFSAGPASFDVSFGENPASGTGGGISYSASGVLASPPVAPPPPPGVPEPASMALLGAGLAGLGLVRRRRKS